MRDRVPGMFRQPDSTTCGSAVLVRARMLADPDYDRWLCADDDPGQRFADEAQRTHRRTNRMLDSNARPQLPWPRALGTPPWALAHELGPGASRTTPILHRDRAWDRIVGTERPVAVYVGNRFLPRHVVLVVGADAEGAQVFEPASGATVTVTRDAFLTGSLSLAGWDRPWFLVAG